MTRTYHVSVFHTIKADSPEEAVTVMKQKISNPEAQTYRVTPEGVRSLTVFIEGHDTDSDGHGGT